MELLIHPPARFQFICRMFPAKEVIPEEEEIILNLPAQPFLISEFGVAGLLRELL